MIYVVMIQKKTKKDIYLTTILSAQLFWQRLDDAFSKWQQWVFNQRNKHK